MEPQTEPNTPADSPRGRLRYPTAIVVRVYPAEREAMNAAAAAAGLTLQNYCRSKMDLPLPEKAKSPYVYKSNRRPVS